MDAPVLDRSASGRSCLVQLGGPGRPRHWRIIVNDGGSESPLLLPGLEVVCVVPRVRKSIAGQRPGVAGRFQFVQAWGLQTSDCSHAKVGSRQQRVGGTQLRKSFAAASG